MPSTRTSLRSDSVIETNTAAVLRALVKVITAVAPNRVAASWWLTSRENAGQVASRKTIRGQIISGRRPKRSESTPPIRPATKPQVPLTAVAARETPAAMCRVLRA